MHSIGSRGVAGLATAGLAFGMVAAAAGGAAATTTETYPGSAFYGFESVKDFDLSAEATSTVGVSGVQLAESGDNGIDAAAGCYYGVAPLNIDDDYWQYQLTRFGGYSNTFPEGGWFASADFYLDVDVETGGTVNQFEWDVASNNPSGSHRRDFILHAQSAGEGTWTLGASNNTDFVGIDVTPLEGDILTIDESGWYTVTHTFADVEGVLSVDISVADAMGDVLHTWTLSDAADTIGEAVGGNRYGWITINGFEGLAIDNVLMNAERPEPGCAPRFDDVTGEPGTPGFSEHADAIEWLGFSGLSTGWDEDGAVTFRPFANTTRDALAEFLYRWNDEPGTSLVESPFADVSSDPASPLYNEHWEAIYWMAEMGLSTGWTVDGKQVFDPYAPVTRDAVAAFLYRLWDTPEYSLDGEGFIDVSGDPEDATFSEHAEAIEWLGHVGLSTGWDTAAGPVYKPTAPITRDAIAAFLYRASMT